MSEWDEEPTCDEGFALHGDSGEFNHHRALHVQLEALKTRIRELESRLEDSAKRMPVFDTRLDELN